MEIGSYYVRRAIQIDASAHQVWHEFQDARKFGAWFGVGHSLDLFEPVKGGRVELSIEDAGQIRGYGGQIIVFDEATELSFENNWFGNTPSKVPTFITFRLRSLYDGTHVELFHHGFERLGKIAASEFVGYESAWDLHHLVELKRIVEK